MNCIHWFWHNQHIIITHKKNYWGGSFSVFTKGPPYGKNSKSWDFQENRYEEIFFSTPPYIFFVSNNQLLIGPKPMITVHKMCPLIFVTKVVTKMGLPACILKACIKTRPDKNFGHQFLSGLVIDLCSSPCTAHEQVWAGFFILVKTCSFLRFFNWKGSPSCQNLLIFMKISNIFAYFLHIF